jgi:serine protease
VTPRIYLIFWHWTNHSDTAATLLTNFFRGAGGSHWAGVTTQYWAIQNGKRVFVTNPPNILAGVWFDDTNAIHNNLSGGELQAEAARGVQHFGKLDKQALYMVATPQDANDAGFNQLQYCAYHSFANGMAWANMPYVANAGAGCGAHLVNPGPSGAYDGVTMAAGHEYLEAVTDPQAGIAPAGWLDAALSENGDKCAYVTHGPGRVRNITLSTGTFAVQGTWSNMAASHLGACEV